MSTRYLLRRLAQAVLLLFLVSLVVFLMLQIAPGDPARLMLGDRAREADVAALREQMGFNRPLMTQYLDYMGGLLQGDFGISLRAQRPVLELVLLAVPPTLMLTGASLAIAFTIGIPLGTLAAVHQGSLFDRIALVLALLGQSVPAFWLGLTLISLVALRLDWLPTSGYGGLSFLVLPAIALAPSALGMVLRVTRISVSETLGQDYVRTARAKGVRPTLVIAKHAFKNASIPIITIVGLQIGALLGGAVITETVFAWPGIGRLAVTALIDRDYPVVQTVVLVAAFLLILINLVVDLLYAVIDKRVQYR